MIILFVNMTYQSELRDLKYALDRRFTKLEIIQLENYIHKLEISFH